MESVTQILSRIEQGDRLAVEDLLPLIYEELRKLAAARMAGEQPGQTLQATALVHEAYLRLVDGDTSRSWNSRGHFFGAAAEAMRRILVENARRKGALQRGGDWQRVELSAVDPAAPRLSNDVLALNEALDQLERKDRDRAELVKLRYFGGLTIEQAAEVLQISSATAHRHWNYARAWLHQALVGEIENFKET